LEWIQGPCKLHQNWHATHSSTNTVKPICINFHPNFFGLPRKARILATAALLAGEGGRLAWLEGMNRSKSESSNTFQMHHFYDSNG